MARVALGRIDQFLNAEQLEGYVTNDDDDSISVKIENGFFAWSNDNGTKEESLIVRNGIILIQLIIYFFRMKI